MTARMTPQQRRGLAILKDCGQPISVDEFGERLGTSREGAAATASALIRKGLVERTFVYLGGARHVMYEVTQL